jgi:AcrR family transcriptional regulator
MAIKATNPETKRRGMTKETILDAAWELLRTEGIEALHARRLATVLGCSTQPIIYVFGTMEALESALAERAGAYHTEYLLQVTGRYASPLLEIGMSYVRFATEEREVFRFLFLQNRPERRTVDEMLDSGAFTPLFELLAQELDLPLRAARSMFLSLWFTAHGMACMQATDGSTLSERAVRRILLCSYTGLVESMRPGSEQ